MTKQKIGKNFNFSGKKILIMGLGLSGGGLGTAEFLAKAGAQVTITDLRPARLLKPSLRALSKFKSIRYVLGKHRPKDFKNADLIVKNPGVLPSSPFLKFAKSQRIPVTSDIGIFFQICRGNIIGVTGTRGKSTTAYLIWKFLKKRYKRVFLGGNIRKSVLGFADKVRLGDWVVLELSSFQLADLAHEKKSPKIAVMTNLLRDHLNWHQNFEEYVHAKSNIFKYQKAGDYLFANPHDPRVRNLAKHAPAKIFFPKLKPGLAELADRNLGRHYRDSVALASAVAEKFGVSRRAIESVLKNFKGLSERQEEIAKIKGVHFIDDTTATSPDAAIACIRRFRPIIGNSQLILIAGGQDKNLDFKGLAREIKQKVDHLILLPGTGTSRLKKLLKNMPTQEVKSVQEAVTRAYLKARRGDWVILSPGAASFGLFLNEFDRGEKFKKAVKSLKNEGQ